jgi:hypothetical protein
MGRKSARRRCRALSFVPYFFFFFFFFFVVVLVAMVAPLGGGRYDLPVDADFRASTVPRPMPGCT